MRRRPIIITAAVAALALLAGACGGGSEAFEEPQPRRLPEDLVLAGRLQVFDDCDQLLNHLRAEGAQRVGPFGLDGGYYYPAGEGTFAAAEDAAPAPDASAQRSEGATSDSNFSETNVQEEGIDEPDTVETDGQYLYVLTNGTVRVLEAASEPAVVAEIDAVNGTDMMLLDDRLVVFGTFDTTMEDDSGRWVARSTVRLIDVSDPTAPAELEKMQVDGSIVNARATDGRVHLVTSSQPAGFDFVTPTAWGGNVVEDVFGTSETEAENANRQEIVTSDLDAWLPRFSVERDGGGTADGRLADCASVYQPPEFAGLGTLTVSTIDPSAGLEPVGSAAVVSNAETVYASPERLYVAMQGVPGETADTVDEFRETSTIHAFDITGPAGAEYTVSGTVDGHLLDQFALSEYEGYLRVASTVPASDVVFEEDGIPFEPMEEPAPGPDTRFEEFTGEDVDPDAVAEPDIVPPPVSTSESFVTVLEETDRALVEVGRVGGLGRGEEIYSVRFVGDIGYVVTFRQVDPLYTVDLSDPTSPTVVGELKIQGYSAYLHPAGDGLLIGVGQDATDTGMTLGTQISLFDVSDLSDPQRIDQVALGSGRSAVEFDHHAFLYHDGLAVVPVESYEGDYRSSALAFEVNASDGIVERGTVTQPGSGDGNADDFDNSPGEPEALSIAPSSPTIERTVVVGDSLFTVSSTGVMATDLDTFEDTGWALFG